MTVSDTQIVIVTFLNASNSNVSTKENLEESSPSEDEASEAKWVQFPSDGQGWDMHGINKKNNFHSSTFQHFFDIDEAVLLIFTWWWFSILSPHGFGRVGDWHSRHRVFSDGFNVCVERVPRMLKMLKGQWCLSALKGTFDSLCFSQNDRFEGCGKCPHRWW